MFPSTHSFIERAERIEDFLCRSLANDDTQALQSTLEDFRAIEAEITDFLKRQRGHNQEADRLVALVKRIYSIAKSFVQYEQAIQEAHTKALQGASKLLEGPSSFHVSGSAIQPHVAEHEQQSTATMSNDPPTADQSLNATIMRRWMLDNIAHPFPTAKDKDAIAEATNVDGDGANGTITANQCTLWFINSRRRSGWTPWARRFAGGERKRIAAIVAALQSEDANGSSDVERILEAIVIPCNAQDRKLSPRQLARLCKDEFYKMRAWVEQGAKDKVGDWMDNVVAEATAWLKTKRRERRAARRRLEERRRLRELGSSEDELDHDEHFQQHSAVVQRKRRREEDDADTLDGSQESARPRKICPKPRDVSASSMASTSSRSTAPSSGFTADLSSTPATSWNSVDSTYEAYSPSKPQQADLSQLAHVDYIGSRDANVAAWQQASLHCIPAHHQTQDLLVEPHVQADQQPRPVHRLPQRRAAVVPEMEPIHLHHSTTANYAAGTGSQGRYRLPEDPTLLFTSQPAQRGTSARSAATTAAAQNDYTMPLLIPQAAEALLADTAVMAPTAVQLNDHQIFEMFERNGWLSWA